jgi:hypothetical protein
MTSKKFALFLFVLFFAFAGNLAASAQKRQLKLSIQDKREVIKLILQNKDFRTDFKSLSEESLYLSTKNIPEQIQRNFPHIKGLNLKLVSPKKAKNSFFHFSFENFEVENTIVKVHFSAYYSICFRDMLYTLWKKSGKWRFRVNYNRRSCY